MYCTYCGSKNSDESVYCGNCGRPINDISKIDIDNENNEGVYGIEQILNSLTPKNSTLKMKSIMTFGGIIIIIVILFLIVNRPNLINNVNDQDLGFGYALIDGEKTYLNNSYPYDLQSNSLFVNEKKPKIIFEYPVSNLGDVILQEIQEKSNTPIDIEIIGSNKYSVSPINKLEDGKYCLIVGNILQTSRDLGKWCFRIGDPLAFQSTETALRQLLESKSQITPPGEGLFFVNNDLSVNNIELIPLPTWYENISDYTELPVTSDKKQIALLKSSTINLDNFFLYRGRPRIGIHLDMESTPCTTVDGGTAMRGEVKIFSVNGKTISKCEEMIEIVRYLEPLDSVVLEIGFGTIKSSNEFTLNNVTFSDPLPLPVTTIWETNYISIVPNQDLIPGVYCYCEKGSAKGYCFRVEE